MKGYRMMKKVLMSLLLLPALALGQVTPVIPNNTVLGNTSGSTGPPSALTAVQVSNVGAGTASTPTTLTKTTGSTAPLAQFGLFSNVALGGASDTIPYGFANQWTVTDSLDSTAQTGNAGVAGAFDIQHTLTSGSAGGKITARFYLTANAAGSTDAGNFDRNYVALASIVNTHNMGGSSSGPTYEGLWYGFNCAITNPVTATYTDTLTCQENDIGNFSTTTSVRQGISIIDVEGGSSPNGYQGVNGDYAILIGGNVSNSTAGHPGWVCGICFGGFGGYFDVATTGTIFSDWANNNASGLGLNASTVGSVMDFHNLTITNYALNFPGFTVDGSGNVTALSVSGPGGGKSPYILAQGGVPFIMPGSATMGNNGALSSVPALAATVPSAYVFAYPGTIGNATATTVTITGTAGQFACTCTGLAVGQIMQLSGTYGGTGSITGYVNPTNYYVSATNGTSTFTLQTVARSAIVTTAGTPTGITYAAGGGWYYAAGGSTTAYTVYNNLYVSGTPVIPASPAAFSTTGIGAYTATISIAWPGPLYTLTGGSLGLNGSLETNMYFKYNNDANAKTVAMLLGSATTLMSAAPTTTTGVALMGHMMNLGVANVQDGWQQQINSGAAVSLVENTNQATNTAVNQNVWIKFTLANAADVIELQSYSVEVRPN